MRSTSSRKCPSLLSLKQEMNATPACAINRDNTKHQSSNGHHRNNDPDVGQRSPSKSNGKEAQQYGKEAAADVDQNIAWEVVAEEEKVVATWAK